MARQRMMMAIDDTRFCKNLGQLSECARNVYVLHLKPTAGLASLLHVVRFLQVFSKPVLESNIGLPSPSPSQIRQSQFGVRSNQRSRPDLKGSTTTYLGSVVTREIV